MDFVTEKYAMLMIRNGKWLITEEIEEPNQERIRTLWEVLGILESDYQTSRDESKIKKSISGERKTTRKQTILQEFHQRYKNLSYTFIRYSGPFLE